MASLKSLEQMRFAHVIVILGFFFRQITTNTLDFLGIQLHAIPKSLKGSR